MNANRGGVRREEPYPKDPREQRGAVAIIVALALVALLALILLAVQVGDLGMVRGLLQGSADQAALAGARKIDGTGAGITAARSEALEMVAGGKNFPQAVNNNRDLDIGSQTDSLQTGIWDLDDPASGFTPSTDPDKVNAVQVIARKTTAQNSEVPMFLGPFLGPETVPVARRAVAAVGNCSELPCGVELPIAGCDGLIECGVEATLITSDNNVDNGCWTGFFSTASANQVRDYIRNCKTIPHVEGGDIINLINGNLAQPAFGSVLDALRNYQTATGQSVTEFDPNHIRAVCTGTGNVRVPDPENKVCNTNCGATLEGQPIDANGDKVIDTQDCGMPKAIPIVPKANCANCNQSGPVSSFALFVITEVKSTGDPKFIRGFPICGVRFGGSPTGPGPTCSPSSPTCCSTEPILVNKDLL